MPSSPHIPGPGAPVLCQLVLTLGAFALIGSSSARDPVRVLNAGRGGNTTRDLLRRLDRDVLSQRPTLVTLMVGTNDMLNHAKAVPLDEYRTNVAELVKRIRNGGARILLFSLPPFCEEYLLERHPRSAYGPEGPAGALDAANGFLREFSRREGLPLVDINLVFSRLGASETNGGGLIRAPANSGARDGVHPTPEGYRIIAAMAFQAIRDNHLPAKRVVCFGDSITYGANVKGQGTAEGETYPGFLAQFLEDPPD
ncbi:MAG: esterase [Kiritimatiellaeota bacterium]|nr:esterase [Kiritimatiellota bacterium]